MIDRPWWELWPERLEQERRELQEAGVPFTVDEGSKDAGILRLNLTYRHEGNDLPLTVVFPELYPFFRFEVLAPTLDLAHHQNPYERNLCLLGRRTFAWDATNTVASLLKEQLPKVLTAAATEDMEALKGLEEEQGEPVSVYYPMTLPSSVIIPGDWTIGEEHDSGVIKIATFASRKPLPAWMVRGAVMEIRAENGTLLHSADARLLAACNGGHIIGRWGRTASPIRENDAGKFLKEFFKGHPKLMDAKENQVEGGFVRLWGITFPEEVAQRRLGDGWVFVCGWNKKRSPAPARCDQPQKRLHPRNRRNK